MTVFHKTPPPWWDQVKDLQPGESRRISDGLKASFNGKGYFVWDFREKAGEVYEPELSLAEKLALIQAQRAAAIAASESITLPLPMQDHPQDWPAAARVWMHSAHFNNDDIRAAGAYWNAGLQRVVLPYRTVDGQDAWIARRVGNLGNGPKYLFPSAARNTSALVTALDADMPRSKAVVITEDLLSAHRVVWADFLGVDAVAAQGTSLSRDTITALIRDYKRVYVWLDPDGPGRTGGRELMRRLGRFGGDVVRLHSDKDPKALSSQEILTILREANG